MKHLRHSRLFAVLTVAFLFLALTLSVSARYFPTSAVLRDGVFFKLTVDAVDDGSGDCLAVVKIENREGIGASNFRVEFTLPEGYVLQKDPNSNALDPEEPIAEIPVSETVELLFPFGLPKEPVASTEETADLPTEAPSETDQTGRDNGGCASLLSASSAVSLLLAAGCLVLLFRNDRRAAFRLFSFLLALLFALPLLPPITASAGVRKPEILLDAFLPGSEELIVKARITYEYSFTETEVKEGTGLDQFEITYYWGPQGEHIVNEQNIADIASAGFTSVPIENSSTEQCKTALELFKKYGLTCSALMDGRITGLVLATPSPEPTQEEVDAIVKSVVDTYAGYDNLLGWYIADEPSTARFSILGKIVSAFRRLDPGRKTMINLFPTYASADQLGAKTYEEYLARFTDEVDPHYISYDHYHFRTSGARKDFFENLELVRAEGLKSGLDQMQIILLTEHMSYKNVTKEEILYEVNMSLVYGMKRISYFTYWIEGSLMAQEWTNSCVDHTGKKYQHYYDVQEINKTLLPLGKELVSKESTAVFHLVSSASAAPTGTEKYTSYGDLGSVSGSSFAVGFFDDNSFLLANKKYVLPEEGKVSNTITFFDHRADLEYFDPVSASWKPLEGADFASHDENGCFVVTFDASEAILFRVAK